MKTYAVLNLDNIVENVIIAPSLEVAENLTSKVCIYVTESTKKPHIGLSYSENQFEQPATEELVSE
jgi:hypothetical protein